jgi:hypothetical protein
MRRQCICIFQVRRDAALAGLADSRRSMDVMRMAGGFLNGILVVVEQKLRDWVGDCEESIVLLQLITPVQNKIITSCRHSTLLLVW